MKHEDITAKIGRDGKGPSTTVKLNLGESLKELIDQFGDSTILQHARSSLIVAAQGFLRGKMTGKEPVTDQKKLQDEINKWKPGTRAPGKSAAEKAKEHFSKLTPEQKKALMKELAAQK